MTGRRNFTFPCVVLLEKGRNPENTFTKTTILRFLIVPNEIFANYLRGRDDMQVKMTQQGGKIT